LLPVNVSADMWVASGRPSRARRLCERACAASQGMMRALVVAALAEYNPSPVKKARRN
jgi:hypothetical protein